MARPHVLIPSNSGLISSVCYHVTRYSMRKVLIPSNSGLISSATSHTHPVIFVLIPSNSGLISSVTALLQALRDTS